METMLLFFKVLFVFGFFYLKKEKKKRKKLNFVGSNNVEMDLLFH
jgi:hypothetical protein